MLAGHVVTASALNLARQTDWAERDLELIFTALLAGLRTAGGCIPKRWSRDFTAAKPRPATGEARATSMAGLGPSWRDGLRFEPGDTWQGWNHRRPVPPSLVGLVAELRLKCASIGNPPSVGTATG